MNNKYNLANIFAPARLVLTGHVTINYDSLHLGRNYLVNNPFQAAGISADNVRG